MGIISDSIIKEYNRQRKSANKKIICHAPFQSINFTQNGNATVCCYNRKHILGTYPQNSLDEIWFGASAAALREYMAENDLSHGCEICALQLNSRNFAGVHASHYDYQSDHPAKHLLKKSMAYLKTRHFVAYPRVIEFELSNTCNLECIMCDGYFSSSIRKNREKLPPRKLVFDADFVTQLEPFIAHLTDAKFLGGEPFLIPLYFDIWERIIRINPRCKVHITTNASLISQKAWDMLEKLNAHIIISVDSISEENYNRIRKGADWKEVEANIRLLHEYTRRKGTTLSLSICPMTVNWQEMPAITQFAIDNGMHTYFNTVFYPENLSLKNISATEATEIVQFYENQQYKGTDRYLKYNLSQIEGLTNMIRFWHGL